MAFETNIHYYEEQPITRQVLLHVLEDYKRPYDKINELVKQEKLVPVKRGVYISGPALGTPGPEKFLLANHISGPSYVSLESALSHWGLIPERVYETSSVTIHRSSVYQTLAGRYSYTHIPLPYYSFGIRQVQLTARQTVLMASPEKAICDKIITSSGILLRSSKQVMAFLTEDLRIEKEQLREVNWHEINQWVKQAPKKSSLAQLVKTLKNL